MKFIEFIQSQTPGLIAGCIITIFGRTGAALLTDYLRKKLGKKEKEESEKRSRLKPNIDLANHIIRYVCSAYRDIKRVESLYLKAQTMGELKSYVDNHNKNEHCQVDAGPLWGISDLYKQGDPLTTHNIELFTTTANLREQIGGGDRLNQRLRMAANNENDFERQRSTLIHIFKHCIDLTKKIVELIQSGILENEIDIMDICSNKDKEVLKEIKTLRAETY